MTNKLPACQAVLFDLDGTLLDTVPLIVESFQYVLQTFDGHPGDEDMIRSTIGTPLESFFSGDPPQLIKEKIAAYMDFNHDRLTSHIGLFTGVIPMLEALRQRNIPLGIVTSKLMISATRSMAVFDLAPWFKTVIAKESTERHKPEADPVLVAMLDLGADDPSRVIFVGDSLHDLYSGQNAGCLTAMVGWTAMPQDELKAAGPDLWLETPDQLIAFVDAMTPRTKPEDQGVG
ncbi:MAG: HAD-IA family hydrolase [Eubacteriales bacterium]|nr:HAD-IA family hydrolase [Eubacteriales bacterium]